MVRVLPWKRRAAAGNTPTKTDPDKKSGASPSPSVAPNKKRNRQSRAHRSGSTSPPPEPLQETFMIEGLSDDDRYHMVEDELLDTARQFTAHLHAAEYLRLKDAAKSQNATVISQISRPVVGGMSRLVEKKRDRAGLLKKQEAAIRKAGRRDDGSDSDDDVAPDSALKGTSLYTLMASPRKRVARLDKIGSFPNSTRAAAGFGARSSDAPDSSRLPSIFSSSPPRRLTSVAVDLDEDDSDDLGAPTRRSSTIHSSPKRVLGGNRNSDKPRTHDPAPITGKKRSSTITKMSSSTPTTELSSETSGDDSDNDIFGVKKRNAQRNTRDRKRAKTTQPATTKAKTTSSSSTISKKNFIPSFL
ncbi:uncharacterized protein PG998_004632 [Apiospora kogelbergensis]|uniref:uncharacterized protein n=1 Tax=Apiospora kogelbergensis TaxID=1337665 RepID=UPI00313137B9